MTKVADIKADPRFPSFITDHLIFKSDHEIKKVFPEIGLSNITEKVFIDNSEEILEASKNLIVDIRSVVDHRLCSLTRYAEVKQNPNAAKSFGDSRKVKYRQCSLLLQRMKALLSKPYKTFIILNDKTGKMTLNLPSNILDDEKKVLFKSGEGLFKVYQKVSEILREGHFIPLEPLDKRPAFKLYNSINIPGSESKIIFSSDGLDGAWDIATMSERGINSCQTWGQSNATHLVGSIVDPCTGIIYLTSGSNHGGKGLKMIRRSIVRFLLNEQTNLPAIILERMYPACNKDVAGQFVSFLKAKTKNKFQILDRSDQTKNGLGPMYIPLTPILSKLEPKFQPYRDSGLGFKVVIGNHSQMVEKLRRSLMTMVSLYSVRLMYGPQKILLKELSVQQDKLVWKALKKPGSPIYSLNTEASFLIRQSLDESLKSIKEHSNPLTSILQIFDGMFSTTAIESLITKVTDRCIKIQKIKISDGYKSLWKTKMIAILTKEIDRDRLKLTAKIAKTKNCSKSSDFPAIDVLKLIDKVS